MSKRSTTDKLEEILADPSEWSYVQRGFTKVYFYESDKGLFFYIADKELNSAEVVSNIISVLRNEYVDRD